MPDLETEVIRLSALPTKKASTFDVRPGADQCSDIAQTLDLLGLRKLRFHGKLVPDGKRDWRLVAQLGATVTQPCAISLAPVNTRLDVDVNRFYVSDFETPQAAEAEMPEDDSVEALPETLSLTDIMIEELDLALPLFPRADGAEMESMQATEPGKTARTDEDARPFAGLAALRDSLTKPDE